MMDPQSGPQQRFKGALHHGGGFWLQNTDPMILMTFIGSFAQGFVLPTASESSYGLLSIVSLLREP